MAEPRNRPALNLDDFEPKSANRSDAGVARQAASELGFTAREGHQPMPFDGRCYRRPSPRTAQLNIATRPEIKDRFWRLAYELDVASGEELLKRMLESFERERGKERTAK
ncbi:hypothetical protein T8K17_22945 [Thalassobaculum sp. OXR-137]|uniref:hypothetical protein n=1 Tax=Thalassobaculum sp. OXR-137 TaxID=3100173 RepID=UPI002AC9BB0E|nr:hypothetical protein [Thalassobaculum sp. OXR-137]WPZ34082.1 hypothetical protein T8K17_22945 [Thalassobaculum sp. OXR-137]